MQPVGELLRSGQTPSAQQFGDLEQTVGAARHRGRLVEKDGNGPAMIAPHATLRLGFDKRLARGSGRGCCDGCCSGQMLLMRLLLPLVCCAVATSATSA